MNEKRVIKKYPNRRLYDTTTSSYITLNDVRNLILSGADIQVVDARTEEDLTHSTLLQVISEQEGSGTPIFSNEILHQFIRSYGNSMQGVVGNFLEHCMTYFQGQQQTIKKQMGSVFDQTPFRYVGEVAETNMALWQKMQAQWLQSMTGGKTSNPSDPTVEPAAESNVKDSVDRV